MDILKMIFPFSFKAKDSNGLVAAIIVYVVIAVAGAILLALLSKIPFIGVVFGILGGVVDLYAVAGIIFAVLDYTKVLK